MENWKLILGIVLALLGLFYIAAPHNLHQSTIGFGLEHTVHIILGVVLLAIGGYIIWKR